MRSRCSAGRGRSTSPPRRRSTTRCGTASPGTAPGAGDGWTTVEAPLDLAGALRAQARVGARERDRPGVLVDCLTVWLGNLMHAGRDVDREAGRLLESPAAAEAPSPPRPRRQRGRARRGSGQPDGPRLPGPCRAAQPGARGAGGSGGAGDRGGSPSSSSRAEAGLGRAASRKRTRRPNRANPRPARTETGAGRGRPGPTQPRPERNPTMSHRR